jgi:hypothetical protein
MGRAPAAIAVKAQPGEKDESYEAEKLNQPCSMERAGKGMRTAIEDRNVYVQKARGRAMCGGGMARCVSGWTRFIIALHLRKASQGICRTIQFAMGMGFSGRFSIQSTPFVVPV